METTITPTPKIQRGTHKYTLPSRPKNPAYTEIYRSKLPTYICSSIHRHTMQKTYIEEQTFQKINFSETPLPKADYEACTFIHCDFSNTDLSGISFAECEFKACNLSTAKLLGAALKDVRFYDCKLMGLHFEKCSEFLFAVSFESCTLNFSSFYKLNLKKTSFKNCTLQEVDFTEADLTAADFANCDLQGATFDHTNLEKADFRTAYNYDLDPESNRIKKARFSLAGLPGLLLKYGIEIE